MLERASNLSYKDLGLKPFDSAILAAILVQADQIRKKEGATLSFCTLDNDLQPFDRSGNQRKLLRELYDACSVWVFADFAMQVPSRPENWPQQAFAK